MGRLRLLLLLGAAALGAAALAAAGKCRAPPALPSRPFRSFSPGCGLAPGPAAGGRAGGEGAASPGARRCLQQPWGAEIRPPAWRLPPPRGALRGRASGSAGAGGVSTVLLGPALYPCPAPLLLPGAPGVLSPVPAWVSLLARYRGNGGGSAQGISLHREILNPGSSFNTQPCWGLLGVCF